MVSAPDPNPSENDEYEILRLRVSPLLLAEFDRLKGLHFLTRSEGIRRSMAEFVERHSRCGDEVA
jgi:hypothetical protein